MTNQILIVDDNELNLSLITRILNMEGYLVLTARNGNDAISLAENNSIDLIFLDVMMPDISGYDLCRNIRKLPNCSSIPIVMLTAMDSDSEKSMAEEAGADQVWSKPFDFDLFAIRMKELIKSNQDLIQ
jgi:DNA-binding response OmpR family regulator